MMPPNIKDAKGKINYKDITYKIVNNDNKKQLKVIISEEYLESVTYPIIVDPSVAWLSDKLSTAVVYSMSHVADMNIHSETLSLRNECNTNEPYIGSEQRVYLDTRSVMSGDAFVGEKVDWKERKIKKATLSLTETEDIYKAGRVEIKSLKSEWGVNDITWNNQPEIGETVGSFICDGKEGTHHNIDLTESIRTMIADGSLSNGLVFIAAEKGTGESFKGPEVTHLGYMSLSIIYDDEYITLMHHDYSSGINHEYDYCYDNMLLEAIEEPYIPLPLVTNSTNVLKFGSVINNIIDNKLYEVDSDIYPNSTVVHIEAWFDLNKNGKEESCEGAWGSGFVVGPDTLITAAHVIYREDYGWSDCTKVFIKYKFGQNSSYYTPKIIIAPALYRNTNINFSYDWAILSMKEDVGKKTGWLGYGISQNLMQKNIKVIGYTYLMDPNQQVTKQYQSIGNIIGQYENKILYNAQTLGGISGGPVFDENNIVWGIHTNAHQDVYSGTRINSYLFSLIKEKRAIGKQKYNYN